MDKENVTHDTPSLNLPKYYKENSMDWLENSMDSRKFRFFYYCFYLVLLLFIMEQVSG